MKRILIATLFLLLLACGQQTTPTKQQPPLKPLEGTPPTALATTTDGNSIAYQLYPNEPGSPGVILLHMLRRTRTDWDSVAQWLQENGYVVIVPDLRGHGQSTGNWEDFTSADFNKMTLDVAAMKSVLENQAVDVKRIVIIGASIGANVALNYAAEDPDIATVVLLSPGLEFRGVKTSNTIARVSKPLLIVASNDDLYSAQSAQQLAEQNPYAQLKLYEDAGHGTNMFVKPDLAPTILHWLQQHV